MLKHNCEISISFKLQLSRCPDINKSYNSAEALLIINSTVYRFHCLRYHGLVGAGAAHMMAGHGFLSNVARSQILAGT